MPSTLSLKRTLINPGSITINSGTANAALPFGVNIVNISIKGTAGNDGTNGTGGAGGNAGTSSSISTIITCSTFNRDINNIYPKR